MSLLTQSRDAGQASRRRLLKSAPQFENSFEAGVVGQNTVGSRSVKLIAWTSILIDPARSRA